MSNQNNSESNYHWLRALAGGIDQPNGFSTGGGRIKSRDAVLEVLARDDDRRPSRIMLSGNHATGRVSGMPLVEIHLYHDFKLAVPIACRNGERDYSAFDDSGRVLASRLSRLNAVLAAQLKELRDQGCRVPALRVYQ
ncbi:MAG: hypothetical protein ACR2RB_16775 [Gammaproteobacteria bacterium]